MSAYESLVNYCCCKKMCRLLISTQDLGLENRCYSVVIGSHFCVFVRESNISAAYENFRS